MKIKTKDVTTKRMTLFLSIVFGILYIPWMTAVIVPELHETVYALIRCPVVFMGTPALAVFITRRCTNDAEPLHFDTKIFRNKKALLFSALLRYCSQVQRSFWVQSCFLGFFRMIWTFREDISQRHTAHLARRRRSN